MIKLIKNGDEQSFLISLFEKNSLIQKKMACA